MTIERKTLLIVDDEEAIHRALARTLRREPYDLLHANDAAEAAALLVERNDIAGVVVDHYMPGTHGLDLLIGIRERFPEIVTILLTAQADLQLVMSALNEGHIHHFVTKPWDNGAFRALLARLLGGDTNASYQREELLARERRLRDELMPLRDRATGAFIVDP
jgi:DNA-binding NtrC family response regulator